MRVSVYRSRLAYLWDLSADLLLRVMELPDSANALLQAEFLSDSQVCVFSLDKTFVVCLDFSVTRSFALTTTTVFCCSGQTCVLLCDDGVIRGLEISTLKITFDLQSDKNVRSRSR